MISFVQIILLPPKPAGSHVKLRDNTDRGQIDEPALDSGFTNVESQTSRNPAWRQIPSVDSCDLTPPLLEIRRLVQQEKVSFEFCIPEADNILPFLALE